MKRTAKTRKCLRNLRQRILLIEPDASSRRLLIACLVGSGYVVHAAASRVEAERWLVDNAPPNLILMKLQQSADDLAMGSHVSQNGRIPIIVISPIDDIKVIVQAIGDFADDYIRMPFTEQELLVRVRRVMARSLASTIPTTAPSPFPPLNRYLRHNEDPVQDEAVQDEAVQDEAVQDEAVQDEAVQDEAVQDEKPVLTLTPIEEQILRVLLQQRGKVVPYEALLLAVWHTANRSQRNTLWVHIRRLRTKIEADPQRPQRLLTVRGVGYCLA